MHAFLRTEWNKQSIAIFPTVYIIYIHISIYRKPQFKRGTRVFTRCSGARGRQARAAIFSQKWYGIIPIKIDKLSRMRIFHCMDYGGGWPMSLTRKNRYTNVNMFCCCCCCVCVLLDLLVRLGELTFCGIMLGNECWLRAPLHNTASWYNGLGTVSPFTPS